MQIILQESTVNCSFVIKYYWNILWLYQNVHPLLLVISPLPSPPLKIPSNPIQSKPSQAKKEITIKLKIPSNPKHPIPAKSPFQSLKNPIQSKK